MRSMDLRTIILNLKILLKRIPILIKNKAKFEVKIKIIKDIKIKIMQLVNRKFLELFKNIKKF